MPLRPALLALAVAPALAAAQAEQAAAADPVATLAAEVRTLPPGGVAAWARAEPRLLALDAQARGRLLAAVAEETRWWAPLLNLYPGLGVGSLASGDRRGAWLTLADGASMAALAAGFMLAMAEDPGAASARSGSQRRTGRALAAGGGGVLVVSRIAGLILPFSFQGRAHQELERSFAEAPPSPSLGAFVAPLLPGRGGGAAAGLALAF